jgi:hypothetical protein
MIGVRKPGAAEAVLGEMGSGDRRLPQGVVMLFLEGVGVEEFLGLETVGELRCPKCRAKLHGHGGYYRYLGNCRRWVSRVRCPPCGVTHGVLPGNVCAYRDLTLETLEEVVEAGSPSEGSRHLDPSPVDGRRVARRLLRAFEKQIQAVAGWLPAVSAGGLDKLRQIFGAQPGVLVRLRLRLMSPLGLWFSGLCGLWRHGRPSHVVWRSSNKPW